MVDLGGQHKGRWCLRSPVTFAPVPPLITVASFPFYAVFGMKKRGDYWHKRLEIRKKEKHTKQTLVSGKRT